ncbi:uncharacterized protein NDAI_0F01240 [Naumovozyma dairenensis CBS 421]|uniref:Uncharacterized protein n=1 Tax=Naumovozyma dairenensis (strain ATCC 10597 / BCRC 20456 / CBS 421 / NBRC 0211 / NRRL Y-12639) TaxID=1071378 RepID=G0WCD2_NAUDC|nr:hypothetical protein NDAI_0F01240 [Naumovozyma dairenensis CBS 421]CCD25443.1 hypothetical protein NDAI_0F01240 [Naumovozyma dairenensis CBS 421]
MDTFHPSKRGSISVGGFQKLAHHQATNNKFQSAATPFKNGNIVEHGPYDMHPVSEDPTATVATINNKASNNTNNIRSPLYSPLDYSRPMLSPIYSQAQQARNYTALNANNTSTTVCEYDSHYPLFGLDWSVDDFVALSSYKEDSRNKIQIIHSNDNLLTWDKITECNVTYSISKMQWLPSHPKPRKLATSSESLRIWTLNDENNTLNETINLSLCKYKKQHHMNIKAVATNSGNPLSDAVPNDILGEFPPITSFHWNPIDTNLLISSSIDTTCIIWDLESSNYVKTQLIAHDSEVFDVRFLTQSTQLFASCGGDGSVRVFDLRSLAHSTIIYEPPAQMDPSSSAAASNALLRLEPSPHDPNIVATFAADSNKIIILDMRNPETPVLTLQGHSSSLNQIKWHPTERNILLSCADDCQVLYWDLNSSLTNNINSTSTSNSTLSSSDNQNIIINPLILDTPNLCYTNNKNQEVNNIIWRPTQQQRYALNPNTAISYRNGNVNPGNGNNSDDWFGFVSGKSFQNVRLS